MDIWDNTYFDIPSFGLCNQNIILRPSQPFVLMKTIFFYEFFNLALYMPISWNCNLANTSSLRKSWNTPKQMDVEWIKGAYHT